MGLSDKNVKLLQSRGLDADLMELYGVGDSKRRDFDISIPYLDGETIVNRKFRNVVKLDGRENFSQEAGARSIFWNVGVISDPQFEGKPLLICEGELDALSAIQAGFPRTVSVPNGAPQKPGEERGDRYRYLDEAPAALRDVMEIVLCCDSDIPGTALLDDLALLLGKSRCKWVRYPKGCKDLNAALQLYGERGVTETINRAEWIAVPGVLDVDQLPPEPYCEPHDVGIPGLEQRYRARLGDLCVVTGVPSHGKSAAVLSIACHMAGVHRWPVAIASFEMRLRNDLIPILKTWYGGFPYSRQSEDELAAAHAWIKERFAFIRPSEDEDATLLWMLEAMRTAVIRRGAKLIVIDPWNEMEHERDRNVSLTEYVGWAIKKLKKFAVKYRVHLIVVAHPAKMQRNKDGTIPPPTLYDISDCYSDDTEVLTRRGWLHHSRISLADEVACFDLALGGLIWQQPTRVVRHDYDGPMLRFKGYGFDSLVTPNHRMVVMPRWELPRGTRKPRWLRGQWSFCLASELPSAQLWIPHAAAISIDGAEPAQINGFDAEDFVRFVGWYLAEGWDSETGIWLTQAVGVMAERMRAGVEALHVGVTESLHSYPERPHCLETIKWYIGIKSSPDLVGWVKENCGKGSHNKKIPTMMFELSRRLKLILIEAFIDGDGHRPKTRSGTATAATTSPYLRDGFQRLAVECGIPCCWSERSWRAKEHHKQSWQLNFGRPSRSKISLNIRRHRSVENYSGQVWCLTVPTGAYVTRRQGCVGISGNSSHWYNKPDVGIVIHRDEAGMTTLRVAKSRYHDAIGEPGDAIVRYNRQAARFEV